MAVGSFIRFAARIGTLRRHGGLVQPQPERHNYVTMASVSKLSDYTAEEEKLRKLYDQARTQGNKKKKREYKDKIAELNRLRKYAERESNKSKG